MIAIHPRRTGMVATLSGLLALPLGLLILLLPLLATELSRPRDSAWGAVLLLLALVLVTSADRLSGAPMLGVLCGGLLIGRLGVEVGQGRWRQLSAEEQLRLRSTERWQTALSQLGATTAQLGQVFTGLGTALGDVVRDRRSSKTSGKRWVRPEPAAPEAAPAEPAAVVASFAELDALITAAPTTAAPSAEGSSVAAIPPEEERQGPAHGEAG